MLWYRQVIFKSKGYKLSSSAECRIWTRVFGTESPADWMPADKPTELLRIKLKTWTQQPVPMISEHSAHSTPLHTVLCLVFVSVITKSNVFLTHTNFSEVVATDTPKPTHEGEVTLKDIGIDNRYQTTRERNEINPNRVRGSQHLSPPVEPLTPVTHSNIYINSILLE